MLWSYCGEQTAGKQEWNQKKQRGGHGRYSCETVVVAGTNVLTVEGMRRGQIQDVFQPESLQNLTMELDRKWVEERDKGQLWHFCATHLHG